MIQYTAQFYAVEHRTQFRTVQFSPVSTVRYNAVQRSTYIMRFQCVLDSHVYKGSRSQISVCTLYRTDRSMKSEIPSQHITPHHTTPDHRHHKVAVCCTSPHTRTHTAPCAALLYHPTLLYSTLPYSTLSCAALLSPLKVHT